LFLSDTRGVDFYTILLVRDPAAVVAAMRSPGQKRKRAWEAVAYIWVVSMLSVTVFRRLPSSSRIVLRYEDFLANPERELRRIGEWLELDTSEVDVQALRPGPVFQGNRMRTQPSVAVRRPDSTETVSGPWAARVAVYPLRRVLGYAG
jgi:hypothetical protein